jgi:small subunit ribosomal protein S21
MLSLGDIIHSRRRSGKYILLLRQHFKKGGKYMPEVVVKKGEPIDRALKRLKGKVDNEGILDEVRRLRAFETPVQKTKRKAKANAKRAKAKLRFNLH